ncbi:MAG TPA: bifunctional phosphoribosylaminoimidazolecarboxamide formyltransferase/IMP cyclohydrolase, partial [Tepidisphaeraceae bacterium]|nr:bifunctional phosphoribosylaminoimidazolecarboxamide formyltransferase/IMP cyclohydrolase [Tepidisphaeraceae bacterium]
MSDLVPIRRALLSVSDKTGLVEFAAALHNEFAVELLSTGGTARALRAAGLVVRDVSEITGFPEMMDGRVKTLHPAIHGALLALRDDPEHLAAMQQHGIQPIDLVCVNLYPFTQTVARQGVSFDEAIENIDIGGPSMIRSAAKNHRSVLVVTSPDRYEKVLGDLREHGGRCCGKHRLKQAQRAFAHTAEYDAAIAGYLASTIAPRIAEEQQAAQELPETIAITLKLRQHLRYGENPHQHAALYCDAAGRGAGETLAGARQLHGKELSYINLLDADAALNCVNEFAKPAACIVKHATPCGAGVGSSIGEAFVRAYGGDPLAAFGGIVAFNMPLDLASAERIVEGQKFLEVIVAPGFAPEALELLKSRWKNVRLLECRTADQPIVEGQNRPDSREGIAIQSISGGFLVQQRDQVGLNEGDWRVVSQRRPTAEEMDDMRLAWLICKHVKSNAIVLAKAGASVG